MRDIEAPEFCESMVHSQLGNTLLVVEIFILYLIFVAVTDLIISVIVILLMFFCGFDMFALALGGSWLRVVFAPPPVAWI